MRTKKGIERLLSEIMLSGELTPDMEENIQKLRDEFDEREGILQKYGETYDGEDEEYEWKEREDSEDKDEEQDVWKTRYQELKEQYVERFFGKKDEIMEEQKEDIIEDGEPRTFDTLLYDIEGGK